MVQTRECPQTNRRTHTHTDATKQIIASATRLIIIFFNYKIQSELRVNSIGNEPCHCNKTIHPNQLLQSNNSNIHRLLIPVYHLLQVCDRCNPMIHILTVPARGNTAYDSQSTHQKYIIV